LDPTLIDETSQSPADLLIEMVVDLSMNWAEFLRCPCASKPLQGPFRWCEFSARLLSRRLCYTKGSPARLDGYGRERLAPRVKICFAPAPT